MRTMLGKPLAELTDDELRECCAKAISKDVPEIALANNWQVKLPHDGWRIQYIMLDMVCKQPWETVIKRPYHWNIDRVRAENLLRLSCNVRNFDRMMWGIWHNQSNHMRHLWNVDNLPPVPLT